MKNHNKKNIVIAILTLLLMSPFSLLFIFPPKTNSDRMAKTEIIEKQVEVVFSGGLKDTILTFEAHDDLPRLVSGVEGGGVFKNGHSYSELRGYHRIYATDVICFRILTQRKTGRFAKIYKL